MQTEEKITALYCRISQEDIDRDESNSITHQKTILVDYANRHGFYNCRFYIDDGVSGTTSMRDGFLELSEDICKGLVERVIVKDLSRVGRNRVVTDHFVEIVCLEHNVELISIGENINTRTGENLRMLPIINFMNEWYAADISDKQKRVIISKGNSGEHTAHTPPYGFVKNENGEWVVDPVAAENVRTIFRLFTEENYGCQMIANYLTANKVLSPSAYSGKVRKGTVTETDPYLWGTNIVGNILDNQEYCGDTVNFKTEKVSFKSKKIVRKDKDDYKVFTDTHAAIISRSVFEKAQEKREKKQRRTRYDTPAFFSNVLYCADCKNTMYIRRVKYNGSLVLSYVCSGYTKKIQPCTAHYIREEVLRSRVFEVVERLMKTATEDFSGLKNSVLKKIRNGNAERAEEIEKRYDEIIEKRSELGATLLNLYADRNRRSLDHDVFCILSEQIARQSRELEEEQNRLLSESADLKIAANKAERFFKTLSAYLDHTDRESFSYNMIHDLIERIEVHEGKGEKRNKSYKIDVYFVGIGLMDFFEKDN
ncbi:MAG: recombinase family protein [Clostridia bacterium]|nr:recombinase family protein [Clostridia bacterium]